MSHLTLSPATRRAAVSLGIAFAAIALARPARAQWMSAVDAGSRAVRLGASDWQGQLSLSPFARYERPRLSVDGRWTVLGREGGDVSGEGHLVTTVHSPVRAGFRFSADAFGDHAQLDDERSVTRLGGTVGLSYRLGGAGGWISREMSRDNLSTPLSPVPRVSLGGWRQFGSAVMTVSLSSFGSHQGPGGRTPGPGGSGPDTLPTPPFTPPDTGTRPDSSSTGTHRAWNDAEVALHWGVGRVAFRGVLGTRFSTTSEPNERWANVQGTLALGPQVALVASAGVRPSSFVYGVARARFVDVGLRVAPSALLHPRLPGVVRPVAAAFEVNEGEGGRRTIRIRVPNARTVELSGDFTNWKPLALTRAGADRWELTLALAPGVHRLAIRVDGDSWRAPPGVSVVEDEFQGTVGVIVVR